MGTGHVVRDFPFDAIPRLRAADQALLRQLRRHLGKYARPGLHRWAKSCLGLVPDQISLRVNATWQSPPPGIPERLTHGIAFALHGPAGAQATLVLDGPLARGVLAAVLRAPKSMAPTLRRLTSVEEGLIAFTLSWLISETRTSGDWHLLHDVPPRVADDQTAVCECHVRMDHAMGLAWVVVPHATGAQLPPDTAAVQRVDRLRSIPLFLPCEVVSFPVRLAALGHIAPGDIITAPMIPPPKIAPSATTLRMRVGRGAFPVSAEGEHVRIVGPFDRSTQTMSDRDETPESATDTKTLVDALEVQLVVELGRVELNAAQVMELGQGDVLSLGKPPTGLLDVRAGGRLLGRGELVDVDGEAGIRLIELFD